MVNSHIFFNLKKIEERMTAMLNKEGIVIIAILSAAVCFLASCGGKLKVEPIPTSENPAEHINRLFSDLDKARSDDLNFLAPTWFAKAEESLNAAKKGLDRGAELSEIFEKIAYGRARLERAEEIASLSRIVLGDAIRARGLARAADAANLGEDYTEAEKKFLELRKAIEKDNVRWAQKKVGDVIEDFRELELRAIKCRALGEARKLIEQADKENARKFAPETFAVAQEKLMEVDGFISKYRDEKEAIRDKAGEALFQARRLVQVTRQSKKVRTMKSEPITLWMEGILYKTAQKLSASDMRDKAVDAQVENILGSIAALQEKARSMAEKVQAQQAEIEAIRRQQQEHASAIKEQIVSLEGLTREEQTPKERFMGETRSHQLFNQVRTYFEPNEAEVYRQGNQLVVRLKAIKFSVGEHVVLPKNYALLSRVQRAIQAFGEPDVVIEGYTDSTGSYAFNQQLSQDRADAVREYFVANETLPEERIVAVGYGPMRPLAPNETPEGRAINRRIDVIITPRSQTGQ